MFPAFTAAAANPKASSMSPRRGGTFRIIQEQVTTLDPKEITDTYSATVTKQIHNGLLTYSTNLTPIPDIAQSWIISRDGTVFLPQKPDVFEKLLEFIEHFFRHIVIVFEYGQNFFGGLVALSFKLVFCF